MATREKEKRVEKLYAEEEEEANKPGVKRAKTEETKTTTSKEKKKVETSPQEVKEKKVVVKEEEEPEEFYFGYEDKEFVSVCDLAREWCKLHKVGHISNSTEGDIVTSRFSDYVEKEHEEVARLVKKDGTIYEAVLMYLNDNDELDDNDGSEDEKDSAV